MKSTRLIALLLAVVMLFALAACGAKEETKPAAETETAETKATDTQVEAEAPEEEAYTGPITVGSMLSFMAGHFDCTGRFANGGNMSTARFVFDTILTYDLETNSYYSRICSDYGYDADANEIWFTLKDDIYFNNSGEQMQAEDLLFSIEGSKASTQAPTYAFCDTDNATISDDGLTLTIPCSYYEAQWQRYLGKMQITNKSWVEEHGGTDGMDWYDYTLIDGSGPYVVDDYQIDLYTSMTKVENWWGENDDSVTFEEYANGYEALKFVQYTDENTMMVDFETGVVDAVLKFGSTTAERYVADPSLGTIEFLPGGVVAVVELDLDDEYLSNINLRAAIAYAVDWDQVGQLAFGSLHNKATSTLSSINKDHLDNCYYEYNPDLAKEYIAKFEEETGTNIEDITLTWVSTSDSYNTAIGESVQYQLSQVGINVDLQVYEVLSAIALWETEGGTQLQTDMTKDAYIGGAASDQYRRFFPEQTFFVPATDDEQIAEYQSQISSSMTEAELTEAVEGMQTYMYENYIEMPVSEWSIAWIYNPEIISNLDFLYVLCTG